MGDLANMTNVHGEVNGFRLLRWLRSKLEIEQAARSAPSVKGGPGGRSWLAGRVSLLREMADDLEAELTPPDYPGDDGDGVDLDDPALTSGPEGR